MRAALAATVYGGIVVGFALLCAGAGLLLASGPPPVGFGLQGGGVGSLFAAFVLMAVGRPEEA